MTIRRLLLSASAAMLFSVSPVAAQTLRSDFEYRCSFQNNFLHPLESQDCDNERTSFTPDDSFEPARDKHRKDPHKFKKKIVHWKWDHRPKHKEHDYSHGFDHKSGKSGGGWASASNGGGSAAKGSDSVSRTVGSVSRTVGGLLD
jgi:hypothetical protein